MDLPNRIEDRKAAQNGTRVYVFESRDEMRQNTPFKLYKVNQDFPFRWDHTHDYVQIWYANKGEFIHEVNQHKYKMVAGNLYVIPPNIIHRFEMIPGKQAEIIGCEFLPHFPTGHLHDSFHYFLFDEGLSHSQVAFSGDRHIQLKLLLEQMLQEYDEQQPHYELMIEGGLLQLLALLIREWNRMPYKSEGKPNKHIELMEDVIQYIQHNYREEIRLDDICKVALLSRTSFCDMFKQYTGKTFSEYVIDLRLSKSMEMLLTSDRSVTDICFYVGFNHLTHFSTMFKRHTGVSPMYYKKNARKYADKTTVPGS